MVIQNILWYLKSWLFRPQVILVIIIAACIIAGGALLYQEWDARRPMEISLPQITITTPTTTEDDLSDWRYPAITPSSVPSHTPFPAPASSSTSDAAVSLPPLFPSISTGEKNSASKPLSLKPDEIGRLIIDGKKIAIKRGVSEATLNKNVGWMETSAAPGQPGVCVLMGHRDQDLKRLKNVEIGSAITIETVGGSFTYTVYAMNVLDSNALIQVPASTSNELMIVTCYPFFYSGSAPQQIIIMASSVRQ